MTNSKKMLRFILVLFIVLAGITGGTVYFAYNYTDFTTYSKGTNIANLNISGLIKTTAEQNLKDETTKWSTGATVNIVFQNYTLELDKSQFLFDVEGSFDNISNGKGNTLIVSYKHKDYISGVFANDPYLKNIGFDIAKVEAQLQNQVSKLKNEINLDI